MDETDKMDEAKVSTLGQKRKLYNECVKGGHEMGIPITSQGSQDIRSDDVDKLMKIDLACLNRNLHFVLNTLKEEDMLYVSRVIKQSPWLISDVKYSTVINPEYLKTNLYPKMTTKAIVKLKKHIRLNLKDEGRVEAFYNDESELDRRLKWLPHCSLPFIKEEVKKHSDHIDLDLFKRLCLKSIEIFEVLTDVSNDNNMQRLQNALFVLSRDPEKYLTAVEKCENIYELPQFGVKGTIVAMKHDPNRIINNILKYIKCIHLPTLARLIRNDEIKDVLYKFTEIPQIYDYTWVIRPNAKYFIERIPDDERFNFVKAVFIDKIHISNTGEFDYDDEEIKKMGKLFELLDNDNENKYLWYQYGPFETTLSEVKSLIRNEQKYQGKYKLLNFLAECVGSDSSRLRKLLQYYNHTHKKDNIEYKHKFISKILNKRMFLKHGKDDWSILNDTFKNMNVYLDADQNKYQNCIECIIVYKVINDEEVPEVIERKFVFNTLKQYCNKINEDNKNKIFNYLYHYLFLKIQSNNAANKSEFQNKVDLIFNMLQTINDWNKNIIDYPFVLNTIKELVDLKNDKQWPIDLSKLYNVKKSWRIHMFDESFSLNPCEEVFLNALKHNPDLLVRNKSIVDTMICNDKVSLNRVIRKLRIFWPTTLAKDWTDQYLSKLDGTESHKALVKGLCTILPENRMRETIAKYAPKDTKVRWNKADQTELSLQRNIATYMHLARPQPSHDLVLLYTKGDYLQYALPSLLAVSYNLSMVRVEDLILKLLDAPVSLRKHGLRLIANKLKPEEVMKHFRNIWNSTKNATLRAVLFKLTYDVICREKEPAKVQEFWTIMVEFIDNLKFKDDRIIYELLSKPEKIPVAVRAEYVMKSCKFMKSIAQADIDREHYEAASDRILVDSKYIIASNYPEFIADILLNALPNITMDESARTRTLFELMFAYLLVCNEEESQNERFTRMLIPFLQRIFDAREDGEAKKQLNYLLTVLLEDFSSFVTKNNLMVPVKLISNIQIEIEKRLTVPENYIVLTKWKLTAGFTKLLGKIEKIEDWESSLAKQYGIMCKDYLKKDVETHFFNIYELFSRALQPILNALFNKKVKDIVCVTMLSDQSFVPAYLAVLSLYCWYEWEDEISKHYTEHPSAEIKMHYFSYVLHS